MFHSFQLIIVLCSLSHFVLKLLIVSLCQPCNFVQLVIAGKAKGELDKANKESTSEEEGSRGLVGT